MSSLTKVGDWRKSFSALRNRNFTLYWIGTFGYYGGLMMRTVTESWLVYEITKSAFLLGLMTAIHMLPLIIFSVLGGIIADRVKKKKPTLGNSSWVGT